MLKPELHALYLNLCWSCSDSRSYMGQQQAVRQVEVNVLGLMTPIEMKLYLYSNQANNGLGRSRILIYTLIR